MSKVRAICLSTSLDGFMAGPDQSLENPLGRGGMALHNWQLATRSGREMIIGDEGGSEGIDNDFVRNGLDNEVVGAHVMGRNMFGPIRGEWDLSWTGWWGDEPVYHHDVFVLTHYEREPIALRGTTFYFVTEGIEVALKQAQESAGDRDVRIGGGASTVRQYIEAGLLDELHIVQVPVLLGNGEPIFGDRTADALANYELKYTPSDTVSHVQFLKR